MLDIWPSTIWKWLFKPNSRRKLIIGESNYSYPNNIVFNTKYIRGYMAPVYFIVIGLIEQFSINMNIYFLFLAILQMYQLITPINPVATWVPLIGVVGLGMLKELFDDIIRWRSDGKVNSRVVTRVDETTTKCKNLRVGDLIRVNRDDYFPADVVLLQSLDGKDVYIETSQLDGEMDYKQKDVLCTSTESMAFFMGRPMDCKHEDDCTTFKGNVHHSDSTTTVIDGKYFVPQGCTLKISKGVIGVVTHTGMQTWVNTQKSSPKLKWTRSDIFLNRLVLVVFILQMLIMTAFGIIGTVNADKFRKYEYYLKLDPQTLHSMAYLVIPLRFLLLSSLLIPQSLKVTLDIAKIINRLMIQFEERKEKEIQLHNSNIAEDIGQIEHLFTDKTGTLTENIMHFRKCMIMGEAYDVTVPMKNVLTYAKNQNEEEDYKHFLRALTMCNSIHPTKRLDRNSPLHSIMSTTTDDEDEDSEKPSFDTTYEYHSSNPDEECLLKYAQSAYEIQYRDDKQICIHFFLPYEMSWVDKMVDERENYRILHIIKYSSERRRMTIILQNEQKEILVYTKGADDSVLPRCKFSKRQGQKSKAIHKRFLNESSSEGLRTLAIAYRKIDEKLYNDWKEDYIGAFALHGESSQNVEETYERLESKLTLLGITAVEDKLQEGVIETVSAIQKAGITTWMLTGDKKETAIQTAKAAQFINLDSNSFITIDENLMTIEEALSDIILRHASGNKVSMCLSGNVVERICNEKELFRLFTTILTKSSTVVCYRMTPRQKRIVVEKMKHKKHMFNPQRYFTQEKRCMAVGDGGNDVGMIRSAHVGVGIQGREGSQAARSADVSILRFKHLRKLLLVHGRRSYRKLANISLYTIYKSYIVAFIQLVFAFQSEFSGSAILDSFVLLTYNSVFTSLLPFAFLMEVDLSEMCLLNCPQLYLSSQKGMNLNWPLFSFWSSTALYQAVVLNLIVWYSAFAYDSLGTSRFFMLFTMVFLQLFLLLIVIRFQKVLYLSYWMYIGILILSFSLFAFGSTTYTGLSLLTYYFDASFIGLLSDYFTYLNGLLGVVVCLLPIIILRFLPQLIPTKNIFPEEYARLFDAKQPRLPHEYNDLLESVEMGQNDHDFDEESNLLHCRV